MVMKKNVMRKNLYQSILKSIGRYLAIVAIIALGAGIFVGLRATKFDMVATGQVFTDEQNMFDLRLMNTYGWTQADVDAVAQMDGVVDAEGVFYQDAIATLGNATQGSVYRFYAIPEKLDMVYLQGGRMPESPNECLADGLHATDAILGSTFVLAQSNEEDTLENFTYQTYTVVGYVSTPLYMDMSRGNTSLGNGSISSYVYIPQEGFDVDYFTEIHITIPGQHQIYTEEYDKAMDDMAERLESAITPLAQDRFVTVKREAEEAYADGLQELEDGLAEYLEGKAQAERELQEGYLKLVEGRAEIDANRQTLMEGEAQLEEAQELLDENALTISQSRQTLAEAKASAYSQLAEANAALLENYKTVSSGLRAVESGLSQINDGLSQIDSGISQLESGLDQLDLMISLIDTLIGVMDTSIEVAQSTLDQLRESGQASEETIAQLEQRFAQLQQERQSYADQLQQMQANRETYGKQLDELYTQREALQAQKAELEATKLTLDEAIVTIDAGFLELQSSQTQAENEFAAAEAKLESGEVQLSSAQRELDSQRKTLEKSKQALADAEAELAEGWESYNRGAKKANRELSEAQLELTEAQAELREARSTIDKMGQPDVYALTRNTNVGYISLDSNSDIVAGVSKVFPFFFLLVAAMVCITTMTRMVEEERTQIGTLKALGYSNHEIISKYMLYAGSAAVIGCGLGVLCGSVVFPRILWEAYKIMMNIKPAIEIRFDWELCLSVLLSYTLVTLAVTWYCCRMTLREVPAELIRPKPPTTGKKILLEYLPFWNKISFLNKVMLRNVFRYRQRLLMMLLGIGGCTALLVTGFGIRDSIMDVVSYQYEEVTLYDMEVRFSDAMTADDQAAFYAEVGRYSEHIAFFHQSSVELGFDGTTKDITMIAAGDQLEDFIDFHSGATSLEMPGKGEALLTIGVAEAMGIEAGDTITVRDSDMRELTVTVAAVYDNNVYNYVIVTPETVAEQWGEIPQIQMAFITVRENQDVHATSAKVTKQDKVMNVTVSRDLADQVTSMLDALNLVVATVVFCAGLLAAIVLYNLTNINITERIREIATIKVLGFNAGESAAYVFKENLLLSGIGAFLGLFGGKLLLDFVMSQIRIDMVWFQARVLPISYFFAIALTILCACIVDFLLYFKLEKINMAEALKSVE